MAPFPQPAVGYLCSGCQRYHLPRPMQFHMTAPAAWHRSLEGALGCRLDADICIVGARRFFVHALIELSLTDADGAFVWGVWVELSQDEFADVVTTWDDSNRTGALPVWVTLDTELPGYSTPTLGLKALLHQRPPGLRPLLILEPAPHPLVEEQRHGLSVTQAHTRSENLTTRN